MSEYIFLIDKLEQAEKLSKEDWMFGCEKALNNIKKEENYLFFKMNESVEDQLNYYSNNMQELEYEKEHGCLSIEKQNGLNSELEEIIEVLDETMAIHAYHNILLAMINVRTSLEEGLSLEYLMVKEEDLKTKENTIGYFSFPEGTFAELQNMKNEKNTKISEAGGMFS